MVLRQNFSKYFIVIGLSVIFVFFQNFQQIDSPRACRAVSVDESALRTEASNLNLSQFNLNSAFNVGDASKKSECLRLVVERLDEVKSHGLEAFVRVVLADDLQEGLLSEEAFVADFDSRELMFNSGVDSSNEVEVSIGADANTATFQDRFEKLAFASQPLDQVFTIDGFVRSCPGCFSLVQRRIVEDEKEVCHELKLIERITQSVRSAGLTVTRGKDVEYLCREKVAKVEKAPGM